MKSNIKREARSYLFVPGNRPERFAKALAAGADAVIVDLEDAVGPTEKGSARDSTLSYLQGSVSAYVRINGVDTPWFADDVAAFGRNKSVKGLVIPKAADTDTLRFIAAHSHSELSLLPLIESAAGFKALDQIATEPRVERLLFGTVDFQVDTGINGDGEELSYFRSQMTLASRLAGIASPIDGVTTTLDDPREIEEAARRARRFGFGGKLCIHPKQIAPTHNAFAPSIAECEWAQRVLDAAEASTESATVVDGKLVDVPVIHRARAILGSVR